MVYANVCFYAPQFIQLLQEAGCMTVHLFLEARCYQSHITTSDKGSICHHLAVGFALADLATPPQQHTYKKGSLCGLVLISGLLGSVECCEAISGGGSPETALYFP